LAEIPLELLILSGAAPFSIFTRLLRTSLKKSTDLFPKYNQTKMMSKTSKLAMSNPNFQTIMLHNNMEIMAGAKTKLK
jgi:hypothetical protein